MPEYGPDERGAHGSGIESAPGCRDSQAPQAPASVDTPGPHGEATSTPGQQRDIPPINSSSSPDSVSFLGRFRECIGSGICERVRCPDVDERGLGGASLSGLCGCLSGCGGTSGH